MDDEELMQDEVTQAIVEPVGRVGKIGPQEVEKAMTILQKYKDGKATLEQRIIENEIWYRLRHWDVNLKKDKEGNVLPRSDIEPTSAWLFNSILNKHADAMDNYPEPNILPREQSDKAEADKLTSIIPVVLEQNNYEQTYNDKWWDKLKSGTGVEGVFWNKDKLNGLGDVEIKTCDILNLFWQPGVSDIQKSRHFFNVTLVDNEELIQMYPYLTNKLGSTTFQIGKYVQDDTIDTTEKSVVVDWYYKQKIPMNDYSSREVVHYCKFCNGQVIYASENDETYVDRGFYDHAKYPFEFDVLFPIKDSPCGFGYIDIMRSPQIYIDKLNQLIMKNGLLAGEKRYFTRIGSGINEEEYADTTKKFVHVEGNLDENNIREIENTALPPIYLEMVTQKVDELKETSGNRDFSQGGTASGVTAASAIAALQEAGSKLSRDMIKSSYRSFGNINYMVIELVRQFYTEPRSFRITNKQGQEEFVQYQNNGITPQSIDMGFDLGNVERTSIFDIKVKSQKANPFSVMAQNEMAKEFYNLGFFNPQMAEQSLVALDMMSFEGKEAIMQKIQANSLLMQQIAGMQQQMLQMATILDAQNGTTIAQGMMQEQGMQGQQPIPNGEVSTTRVETNPLGKALQTSKNNTATTAKEKAINTSQPK